MRKMSRAIQIMIATLLLQACTQTTPGSSILPGLPAAVPTNDPLQAARSKIKHIVIIMQENRSFDEYFGTYPGADGIPMQNGVPAVCVPDPKTGQCVKPFHNTKLVNAGGPHAAASASTDIDGGKMDGFIKAFRDSQVSCKGKPADTP